ncbi:MAG: xanthine dehydrogenase family protein molybdopterin-binding subunit [Myxococcales bacterium]|nr:xanthine dehydrogenase family protein molybdopterin-binding subunit [Myxococcales bacterium]
MPASQPVPGTLGMIDARERVTGRIPYTIDVSLPGMVHARLLRSTEAHARLVRVDVSRARALKGVAAVITSADLVGRPDLFPYMGPVYRDQPILAIERVRYSGEPIAAVAAVDLDTAQAALDLIEVDYEPLPAVFDAVEALEPGAPILHAGPPRTGPTYADIIVRSGEGTNVCNYFVLRKGDVEAGFAGADHVFEDEFTCPPAQAMPMETHCCVADVQTTGIRIWSSSQTPFAVRATIGEILPRYLGRIRVIVPTLGGGYGAKAYPKVEPVTVLLSLVAGRPVRLHLTRAEEFVTVTKHGVRIRMTTGLRAGGTIVARKTTCWFNTGAYADIGPRLIKNGGIGTGGPHHIPNVWVDSYAIYTNLPPAGAYRGYGINQAAWAYETQMDMIAERLGMDPLELRMRNLLVDGQTSMVGTPAHDLHFRELLAGVAGRIGWGSESAPAPAGRKARGKGLSVIIKGTITPSTSTAGARLDQDGSLHVLTSSVEMGQGVRTLLARIAGGRLGLAPERVSVTTPDTDATPYDQVTGSSRSSHMMGTAVERAVDRIREQLLEAAAAKFEISPADLELADGSVRVKGSPGRAIAFPELLSWARLGSLQGEGTYQTEGTLDPQTGQGISSLHWHQAAGAAEVEVDLDTGRVEVLRYEAAVYAGRAINPVQCQLQAEGNVAFGVGQALFEEMAFDAGQLQNGSLADYMVAYPADMPAELGVTTLENWALGEIHGIGETGLPPVAPAIGNAIAQATGIRITDLPITPERILRALREKHAQRQPEGDC